MTAMQDLDACRHAAARLHTAMGGDAVPYMRRQAVVSTALGFPASARLWTLMVAEAEQMSPTRTNRRSCAPSVRTPRPGS
jgi:hypothetical protein